MVGLFTLLTYSDSPQSPSYCDTSYDFAISVWLVGQQYQHHQIYRISGPCLSAFLSLNLMNLHFKKMPRWVLLFPENQDPQDQQTETLCLPDMGARLWEWRKGVGRRSVAGVLIWLGRPLCSPNPNCLQVIWLVFGMNNVISDFLLLPISHCFDSISYTDFVLGPWLRPDSLL